MRKYLKYILRSLLAVLVVIVAIHVISALTLDRIVEYKEISLSSPRLPKEMDGYVVAFITDTHYISPDKLNKIVTRINARGINLLALGGDYPDDNAAPTLDLLSDIKAIDGVFGVGGNHDNFYDLARAMQKYGLTHLDNKGLFVKPNFFVGGVEFSRQCPSIGDIEAPLSRVNLNDFSLIISHNPDIAMESKAAGTDLILAGHTHGGHMTFFGLWSPTMWPSKRYSNYGLRFMRGWAQTAAKTTVYVSNGLGQGRFTPRVFARPQVIFITLHTQL